MMSVMELEPFLKLLRGDVGNLEHAGHGWLEQIEGCLSSRLLPLRRRILLLPTLLLLLHLRVQKHT